ncbi:MAG: twin-arginine translocase subunit TatC, partial [Mycobacteriales bacterium]
MGILPQRRERSAQPNPTAKMPFLEHVRELRQRLLKASLAIVIGLGIGLFFADQVLDFINQPYCDRFAKQCRFTAQSPLEPLVLNLKVALYIGLLLACPVWLYQLWAFIAPGLHKREKKWSYIFVAVAAPLFLTGAFLAYFVVARALEFLLTRNPELAVDVNLTGYFDFVTGMFLVFGVGFEFPLVVFMLNVVGVASAAKLLSWWRIAVLVIFIFTA